MNKIYRIVFNTVTGRWVVASELATGRKKQGGAGERAGFGVAFMTGAVGVLSSLSAPSHASVVVNGNPQEAVASCELITDSGTTTWTASTSAGACLAPSLAGTASGQGNPGSDAIFYASNLTNGAEDSLNLGGYLDVWKTATFHGGIAMSGQKITGLADGTAATDAATVGQLTGAMRFFKVNSTVGAASAAGADAVAVGSNALASGTRSTSMGAEAQAITDDAIAIGSWAAATGDEAVAIGVESDATAFDSTAVGPYAQATGSESTALGSSATASGDYGVGIGAYANASGDSALASGFFASASGDYAAALGAYANASGLYASALGEEAVATGKESTAIGSVAKATADGATAVGGLTEASGSNSVATGYKANATAGNSVALGAYSTTTADLTTAAYNPGSATLSGAASTANGEVSIGSAGKERRLTNLAAGAAPTDAVNVSQLQAQDATVDQQGANTAAALGGGATYNATTGAITAPSYALANANTIGGTSGAAADVGTGFAKVDGALGALGGRVATSEGNITTLKSDVTSLDGRVDSAENNIGTLQSSLDSISNTVNTLNNGGGIKYFRVNSTAGDASATGADAVAVGSNALASGTRSTSMGAEAQAITDDAIAIGSWAAATGDEAVAIGIESDATGYDSTAVGPYAQATGSESTALGSTATASGDDGVGIGAYANASGDATVASGFFASASGDYATALGGLSNASGLYASALGEESVATGKESTAVGSVANATADGATAVGGLTAASGTNSVATGYKANATANNSVALGAYSTTTADLSTAAYNPGSATLSGTASVANGEVSIGSAGKERRLTNLAAGAAPTDAVNVSQLQAQDATVDQQGANTAAALGGGATYNATTGAITAPSYALANANRIGGTSGAATDVGAGFAKVDGALGALDSRVTTAAGEITTLKSDVTTLGGRVDQNTAAIGSLDGRMGTAESRITNLDGRVTTNAGNISTLQGDMTTLGGRVDQNTAAISTLDGRMGTAETSITGLDARVTNNTTSITTLQGRVDNTETNISSLQTTVNNINAGVGGLVQQSAAGANLTVGKSTDGAAVDFAGTAGARKLVNVADGAIASGSKDAINGGQLYTTNQAVAQNASDLSTLGGRVTATESGLSTINTSVGSLDARVTTAEGDIDTLQGNVSTITTNVGSLDARVTQNTTGLSSLTTSVGSLDGRVSTAESSITTLDGRVTRNTGDITTLKSDVTNLDGRITTNTSDITNLQTTVNSINAGTAGLVQQSAAGANLTVGKSTDGAAVDFAGLAGLRKLVNVADGAIALGSKEVVNGGQLYTTNQAVAQNASDLSTLGGRVTATEGDIGTLQGDVSTLNTSVADVGARVTTTEGDITTLNTNVVSLDARVTQNTTDLSSLTTNVSNIDGRVSNAEGSVNTIASQLNTGEIGLVKQDAATRVVTVARDSDGGEVSFAGTAGARRLTGVAAGRVAADSTEAVNGSQLQSTNDAVATLDGRVTQNAGDIATLNTNVGTLDGRVGTAETNLTALDGRVTRNEGDITTLNTTVGSINNRVTSVEGSVATMTTQLNDGAIGLVQYDDAAQAVTVAAAKGGTTVDFRNASGVSRRLKGVAAGAQDEDAANVGQLKGALGGTATYDSTGAYTGPAYTVTNADGSTRQVNGVGGAITNLDGRVYSNTVQLQQFATQMASGTIGLVQQSYAGASLTVGKGTDGAAVDFAGTNGARKLTSVADGQVASGSKDAVNGGQLQTVSQSVASALGGGASVNTDGTVTAPSYTVTNADGSASQVHSMGDVVSNIDGRVTNIDSRVSNIEGSVTNITTQLNNGGVGLVKQDATTKEVAVAKAVGGTSMNVAGTDGDRTISGVAAGSADNDAVNVGQLKKAGVIAADGQARSVIAYDGGDQSSITLGGSGASQPVAIHNVADGVADHDAVNVSQLNQRLESKATEIVTEANSYTDSRINDVWGSMDKVAREVVQQDRRISSQGAMSMASSQMASGAAAAAVGNPNGAWSVGVGMEQGQGALSAGYAKPVGRKSQISFGAAFSGNDQSIGMGFAHKL